MKWLKEWIKLCAMKWKSNKWTERERHARSEIEEEEKRSVSVAVSCCSCTMHHTFSLTHSSHARVGQLSKYWISFVRILDWARSLMSTCGSHTSTWFNANVFGRHIARLWQKYIRAHGRAKLKRRLVEIAIFISSIRATDCAQAQHQPQLTANDRFVIVSNSIYMLIACVSCEPFFFSFRGRRRFARSMRFCLTRSQNTCASAPTTTMKKANKKSSY